MNPYTEIEQLHRLKAYIYFQQCKSQCITDKPNPGQLTFTLTTQWHAYVELGCKNYFTLTSNYCSNGVHGLIDAPPPSLL